MQSSKECVATTGCCGQGWCWQFEWQNALQMGIVDDCNFAAMIFIVQSIGKS